MGDAFQGQNQRKAPAPQDVVVELACTLEEFYCGSLKKITFDFDEVQHDGKSVARKTVNKTVQVDSGFSSSTVLTFKGEGNQAPK